MGEVLSSGLQMWVYSRLLGVTDLGTVACSLGWTLQKSEGELYDLDLCPCHGTVLSRLYK